jgi:hypothetical protein
VIHVDPQTGAPQAEEKKKSIWRKFGDLFK